MKKLIVNWVIPILCATYLSLVIGKHFAPTAFRYLFLGFMFFFIVQLYLKTYYEKRKETVPNKKAIIAGIILSVIIVGAGGKYLVPEIIRSRKVADITITALGKKNEKSQANEVWLKEINNGGPIDLKTFPLDSGWKQKDNSLYVADHFPATLHVKLDNVSNDASLVFLKHGWSGMVMVSNGKQQDIIDLFADSSSENKFPIDVKQATVINASAAWCVIGYILSFLFFAIAFYFIGDRRTLKAKT